MFSIYREQFEEDKAKILLLKEYGTVYLLMLGIAFIILGKSIYNDVVIYNSRQSPSTVGR